MTTMENKEMIGRMYCPECSHFIDEDEIKDEKCPICRRVTLMRRFKKEDV